MPQSCVFDGCVDSLLSTSVEQTMRYGALLAHHLEPGDVVLLSGDLGAGKTHFVKGIAAGLGIIEMVTSPTFNIVIEYQGVTARKLPITLYHLDLYRLDEAAELEDIDYYGILESDGASVVEWGDRFPEALDCDYLHIRIRRDGPDTRFLDILTPVGERGRALSEAWLIDAAADGEVHDL
jgi:tRNA threonylcarbamoyladenosine biosynthesis protein TsaE